MLLMQIDVSKGAWVVFWLVLLVLFLAVEAATVGLISIWFAVGSLVALAAAAAGGNILVQTILFLTVSTVLLLLTRPLCQRYVNDRMQRTNVDSLIGQEIIIRERVDNLAQTGSADAAGKEWTVRSVDGLPLEAGSHARVKQISGVKLMVEPWEKEEKPDEGGKM